MSNTTIGVPTEVRDRLRRHGRGGMSYAEILTELMDHVDRERFIEELEREADDPRRTWTRLEDIAWD